MSFEGLQERLNALQETTTQLKELIDRLASLKFAPGSVPLTTDEEGSESGELGGEISQSLRDGEEEHELLVEEVEYVRGDGHDKARLRETVEKLGKELASCRLSFRRARLSAKSSLVQAQRLERELLIQSYSRPVSGTTSPDPEGERPPAISRHIRHTQHQQSSLSEGDQQTVGASGNVTNALRRTHDLIAAELARSEYAHETLTESSAALKQLNESYTSLDTMLASSRDLLGTLLRSQKSDTWYLQTALYMLMVTGAWLVFRRLLYGPLWWFTWWFVWLPARLVGTGAKIGGVVLQDRSVPGESGKVQMGEESSQIPVEGLPGDDIPTVNFDQAAGDIDPVQLVKDYIGEINEPEEAQQEQHDEDTLEENLQRAMPEEGRDEGNRPAAQEVVVEDTQARDEL